MQKKIIDCKSDNIIGFIDGNNIFEGKPKLEDVNLGDKSFGGIFSSMINVSRAFINIGSRQSKKVGNVSDYILPIFEKDIKIDGEIIATIRNDTIVTNNGDKICKVENGTAQEVFAALNIFYELNKFRRPKKESEQSFYFNDYQSIQEDNDLDKIYLSEHQSSEKKTIETEDDIISFANTCQSQGINIEVQDIKDAIEQFNDNTKEILKSNALLIRIYKLINDGNDIWGLHTRLPKLAKIYEKFEMYKEALECYLCDVQILLSGMVMFHGNNRELQDKDKIFLYPEILKPIKILVERLGGNIGIIEEIFGISELIQRTSKILKESYFYQVQMIDFLMEALKKPNERFYV